MSQTFYFKGKVIVTTCGALLLGRNETLGNTVLTRQTHRPKYSGTKADNAFLGVLSNQIQACIQPTKMIIALDGNY